MARRTGGRGTDNLKLGGGGFNLGADQLASPHGAPGARGVAGHGRQHVTPRRDREFLAGFPRKPATFSLKYRALSPMEIKSALWFDHFWHDGLVIRLSVFGGWTAGSPSGFR